MDGRLFLSNLCPKAWIVDVGVRDPKIRFLWDDCI